MKVIPRHLATRIERALGTSRVVNIVGPRQAGKTTLVKDLIATARYITLDDDAMRAALEVDPYGQLQLLSEDARNTGLPIVIDEVQRLPEITFALKRIVDADHRPGQFVLTGSSDIFTTGKAYDSLAGRVMTLTLRPLSVAEIAEQAPCRLLDTVEEHPQDCLNALPKPVGYSRADAIDLIVRGGFPEITLAVVSLAAGGADDFRHINWFLSEGPGKSYRGAGFVVYLGDDMLSFGAGRVALPLSALWSFAT